MSENLFKYSKPSLCILPLVRREDISSTIDAINTWDEMTLVQKTEAAVKINNSIREANPITYKYLAEIQYLNAGVEKYSKNEVATMMQNAAVQ